jgi:glycosyltransferase involved in cell wall biosynthesis
MRVLILHSWYSSGPVSGENRVVLDEATLLRAAGHDVSVWCPESSEGRLSAIKLGVSAVHSRHAVREVERLIAVRKPDIVQIHNLYPNLSPSVLRAARTRVPVVLTLHNYRLLCLPSTFVRDGLPCESCLSHQMWRGVVHRCYRGSLPGSAALGASLTYHRWRHSTDGIVFAAVSKFVKEKHVAGGFDPTAIHVKHNFAWAEGRRAGSGEYFLFLGRFSEEKGIVPLLRGWGTEAPRLLVVGDGPQAKDVRAFASPNIEVHPPVAPAAVPDVIRGARAVIVPSRCYEGAPRSIVEAYAAGVPVIAASRGAIPEFVEHGVNGLLVDDGQPDGFLRAAETLTPKVSTKLGEGAFEAWATRFSPEVAIKATEALYETVGSGGVERV